MIGCVGGGLSGCMNGGVCVMFVDGVVSCCTNGGVCVMFVDGGVIVGE